MQALLLVPAALFFGWIAVRRYRGDGVAVTAGIGAGLGGTVGLALSLPAVYLTLPLRNIVTLGCMAVAIAVAGTTIAEVRRSRHLKAITAK